MKAITIKQPWAWAITHEGKDVENRIWTTAYRGPLAIHAAKTESESDWWPARTRPPVREEFVYGAIIAVADLVDVVESHRSKWFGGPYGFLLKNVRVLPKPVPCSGRLRLWIPDAATQRKVLRQL